MDGESGAERAIHITMLAAILLAAGILSISSFPAVDMWWQLAAGRLIAQGHGIPHHDIFSHTAPGASWIVHEWLPCLGMYLLQAKCGVIAIAAAKSILSVLITFLIYRGARIRCGNWAIAGGLAFWGFAAMRAYLGPRPLMLTLLFSVLLLNMEDGFPRRRWLLPLFFLLWANCHLGFLFGLILLGAIAIDQVYGKHAPLRSWILLWLACAAATLVNPYGIHLHETALRILTNHTAMTCIGEWLPPTPFVMYDAPFSALAISAVIIGGFIIWRRRPAECALVGILIISALKHMRQIALFSAVAPTVVAASIGYLRVRLRPWAGISLACALSLLAAALIGATLGSLAHTTVTESAIGPSYFPEKAVTFLHDRERGGVLYNEYDWGGFCLYKLYPRYRVFVDGRAEVYFGGALDDYFDVHYSRPNWRKVLTRYHVDTVLVRTEGPICRSLRYDPGWRVAHEDPLATVIIRTDRR